MKAKTAAGILVLACFWILLASFSWAGQVVTEETKSWAKEAIAQEEALKITSAPNTVAVLYFYNKTGSPQLDLLQKGLALMLITDLAKVKGIQIVERIKVQALAEELGLGVSGLVEPDTAPRMGRLLGAEHIVGGDIFKVGLEDFRLNSGLVNVPMKEIVGNAAAEGALLAELFRMEKDLFFQIIQQLKIELTPEQEAELKEFSTENLKALLYLFQGIEQSDLGNYREAAMFYEKALEEDPGLKMAREFWEELQRLALISEPGTAEAYSPPEREVLPGEETVGPGAEEQRDPRDRDISDIGGEFKPGNFSISEAGYSGWGYEWTGPYLPGLQTIGADKKGAPRLFLDQATLDWINEDGFLAYAVQVEEDRLNRQILEMHRQTAQGSLLEDIAAALESREIRERDDFLMQRADAQSGRVLQDREGNWVRVQQYILRPDAQTVQVLNVCLRGGGSHKGLTTMEFRTTFTDGYPLGSDLRDLPWSSWLNTQGPWKPEEEGEETGQRFVYTTNSAPELASMSVKFSSPSDSYLQESRTFLGKDGYQLVYWQVISDETLTLSSGEVYRYTDDWKNATLYPANDPTQNEYWVYPDGADEAYPVPDDNNPLGFYYMRRYGPYNDNPSLDQIEPFIKADLFVVGDGDSAENRGVSPLDYSEHSFQDIWAVLGVNEGEAPNIGLINNLEVSFRGITGPVSGNPPGIQQPIDMVYIPMSRMLWK